MLVRKIDRLKNIIFQRKCDKKIGREFWMKLQVPFKVAATVALIMMAEGTGWADVLPGPAMPETVSKQLSKRPTQQQAQVLPPVVAPAEKKESVLGPEAQKIKFKLNGVILKGNKVYSTDEIAILYKAKIGQSISVSDLFTIVQNITNFYRNNGYIISRAILPPQHVKDGIVTIQIIEGFLDKVSVGGTPRGAKTVVEGYGKKIKENAPLKISEMELYLTLANEIPGTQVKAVLSPSKATVGAADLTLMTDNRPVTSYLSYDNYGTRYIGPQQMTANVGFNSFAVSGDSGQFTTTRTPKGGELNFADINYNVPLGFSGIRWIMGVTRAHTHPLFTLTTTQIDGLNNNYYTTFQFPIIRKRDKILTLTAGFNYLDSAVTTFDSPLYTDHVRSIDVGGTYNFADSYYGANLITANFRQGLPFFGYTQDSNPATALTSRPGGRADYTKVLGQISRVQAIKGPWSGYGILKGQWAFNPLLASEQFTFGGNPLGRAYDVAELIGDRGVSGSIELRYDLGFEKFFIQTFQLYTFYDFGQIWNMKVTPGVVGKLSATSTGIGTRFFATKYVSGNLMWTQPLTKEVAAEELIGDGWRPRVFFSLVAQFG